MNKIYYPSNIVSSISNTKLETTFKRIGTQLGTSEEINNYISELGVIPTTVIDTIYSKIIQFFETISNSTIDPLLVITCNYFYFDPKKNIVSKIDPQTHPFYEMFKVTFSDVSDNTQSFTIEIDESRLYVFLLNYIYFTNPTFVNDTVIMWYKNYFMLALNKYINEYFNNKNFNYEHYVVPKHTTKNLSYLNSQNIYYDFDSEYNFFIKNYENLVSSSVDPLLTTILPNYYSTQLYLDLDYQQRVQEVITLNNRIEVSKETILSKEYFLEFAETVKSLPTEERSFVSKIKNYLIDSYYSTEQNNTLSSENFPYTAKIKFSNYPVDSLIEVIQEKKLDTLTANNCHYLFTSPATLQDPFLSPQEETFYIKEESIFKKLSDNGEYVGDDGLTYSLKIKNTFYSSSVEKVDVANVFGFTTKNNSAGFKVYKSNDFLFITKENLKNLNLFTKPISIFSYLHLNSQIEQICNKNLDYNNVLNFKALDVYPLCFQIEKYNNRNTINNTVTIARNATNSEISFYDTQLAYEKNYNYKIYSINLINSYKYYYTNVSRSGFQNTITGTINLMNSCFVYKNLIIDKNFEIFDNPPTPVDVNIVPLINSPNSMLFLLNTQSTTLLEEPKIINQQEQAIFNKIRKKQNSNSKKIFFETVDDLKAVQIFRLSTPPKNYKSFSNNLYKVLPLQKQSSNSFVDSIQQNTKYYYTFRSVDVHNNISNPTEVFEVQIINNDGAVYPIVKTYEMHEEIENFTFSKTFKKYLSINPSVLFTEFNVDGENIKIGSSDSLWGQRYKLRIKSKKSGKMFDINISFNKKTNNLIDRSTNVEQIAESEGEDSMPSSDEELVES